MATGPSPFMNTCTGSCLWVVVGGSWFPTESTCSSGCSCANTFQVQGGPVRTIPTLSSPDEAIDPSLGLKEPDFQTFRQKFPEAIIGPGPGGTGVLVKCVRVAQVIEL